MNERVVVVGGSGFLGSHIADHLTAKGFKVTIFDRNFSPWLKQDQEMIVAELDDVQALGRTFKGARYVYHLAGMADIGESQKKPIAAIQSNILGCANVIEACIKCGVKRLLLASTVYVFGDRGSFYRVTKQAAEGLLHAYCERDGIEYTILRYGSLYGPRSQPWNGLHKYVQQAVLENTVIYPGTGDEVRYYIHAHDAARLSVSALDSEFANKGLTIIGGEQITSRELMALICEVIGRDIKIEFTKSKRPDHYMMTPYRFSYKESVRLTPRVSVDLGHGILNMVADFRGSKAMETTVRV